MLAIRMQRTGRKGHAQFRLIVQESRRTPSSGNIVAALGSYDPHTKAIILDKEQAAKYLMNGAQPSPRMAMILQKEGIKLPSWVKVDNGRTKTIKNTEKLRRNHPASAEATEDKDSAPVEEVEVPVAEEAPAVEEAVVAEESSVADVSDEAPAKAETMDDKDPTVEDVVAEVPAETAEEAPAVEAKADENTETTEEETEKTA